MSHSGSDGAPPPNDRPTTTSRNPAAARLARHWKDAVILTLAILTLTLGGLLWRERFAGAGGEAGAAAGELGEISVFEIVLDRDRSRFIDVLFDRPVVEQGVGDILDRPPATLAPSVGGFWVWRDKSVLRFESTGPLPVATEFTLALLPVRFEAMGKRLAGDSEFKVRTDRFLVERVELSEEPAPEGRGQVIFRGRIQFNYAVEPKELATRIRLADTARPLEPIAVNLETTWATNVVGFATAPVQKTKQARTLTFAVSGDLTPARGNVPLGQEFNRAIPLGSSETLAVRGVDVRPGEKESTLRVRLSSPVEASIAEKYLKVEPAAKLRVESAGNELVVTGPLLPGESYGIELGKGLPAADDAVLAETWTTRVNIPDMDPEVDFQSPGMFLPRSGLHNVALSSVNVSRVELSVERVYLNNIFYLFQYQGFLGGGTSYRGNRVGRALGDTIAERAIDLAGGRNKHLVTPLDVDALIEGKEPGLYRLAVNRPGEWEASQRLLLLTDLGIVAKSWQDGFLVWVSSVRDLSSVPGAKVRLFSEQNQVLAEGTTDAAGLWRAGNLAAATKEARPYLVTVERGRDFSFLLLDRMRIDTTGLDVGGGRTRAGGYSAFLYGERDLYRPGEKVEAVALVRDARLAAPPPMPAVLRHRDPLGVERGKTRLDLDERGMSPVLLQLPDHSLTGKHVLELLIADEVVGQYGFQVEEFVPDRIKVEIAAEAGDVKPGEELRYEVIGTYLFGPPAAGLAATTRVRIEDATFAPGGFEGFTFRNPDRKFAAREIMSSEAALDASGRHLFSAAAPEGAELPSALDAVIVARVQEQGGRGVTAVQRARLHPYPYYVGLRRKGTGYAEPGKSSTFEFVAVSPGGTAAEAGALRAELIRDRWQTVLRRLPNGDYRYESTRDPELVDTQAIPGGRKEGSFSFTIPEHGSFRVELTDPSTKASAQISFYAAGWGYAPWAVESPSRVELELDHDEYAPGQSATVLVKAPFPGKLLLTVERDGVYHTRIERLTGNTAELSVPVTSDMRPNAYVTATLVRPSGDLEPGSVARAFGAVPINVDREANRIDVRVEAPERVRSESELVVEARARPGSAVTIAAVDEGILQLIAQKTPDPFAHFYRKLALGAGTFDTYALLLPQVAGAGSATGGGEGGGGLAQYLQTSGIRRVRPVALWSGPLTADSSGAVRAKFAIPEFQGALRVMAIAADGRRFGSAERKVLVRDPIVLTPTVPRFLSFGEHVRIPVTVRNDTAREAEIAVSLAASGAAELDGESPRRVRVPAGREATVYFGVKTGTRSGAAGFAFRAEGNGETARASAELPVRSDLPYQTRESAGAITAAESSPAVELSWARPATLRRSFRIGPVPLVQFSGKLEYLLRYPYGCLEQTVSGAMPLLYMEDLAAELAPDLFEDREGRATPAEMVQRTIERLRGFRLADGAFALWPGTRQLHPWGTVYAAHFLVEARKAGYAVDDGVHDGVLDYLSGSVLAKADFGSEELKRTVYALYVLARAGRPQLAEMDFMRERHVKAMTTETRALLAAAYANAGNLDAVRELRSLIRDVETIERATGRNLDSTVRNRALLLLSILEANPGDPLVAQLVDRLSRDASEIPWWSTQDSALALLAIGRFIRVQHDRPAYAGAVFAGSKEIGRFGSGTVTFAGIEGTEPLRVKMDPGYRSGAAFYSVTARGIPSDEAFAEASAGLEVAREYLDREGKALDLGAVKQGDLIVVRTKVRSVSGAVENVIVQQLLASGIEVENPRLETTETLSWVTKATLDPDYVDLRDDRVLMFLDLPAESRWKTGYALLRAVTPGRFRLPPIQAEAMYNGALKAIGPRGELIVLAAEADTP